MLFLAGHETSASALTWALHLLAQAPDVQRRVHDEVDRVLGEPPAAAPTTCASSSLTRQVFRETLRLFPPVGFLAREAAAADTMRDKSIQPGAAVIVSPWLLQRHQAMWSHPDAFDPDRFSTDAGRASARTAYLPFSSGPRACIGANFALQEATLLIAMLAQRYRFEPVTGPCARAGGTADNPLRQRRETARCHRR